MKTTRKTKWSAQKYSITTPKKNKIIKTPTIKPSPQPESKSLILSTSKTWTSISSETYSPESWNQMEDSKE